MNTSRLGRVHVYASRSIVHAIVVCSLPFGEYESTEATVGTLRASGVCSLPFGEYSSSARKRPRVKVAILLCFSAWEGGTDRARRSGGDVRERKKTISAMPRGEMFMRMNIGHMNISALSIGDQPRKNR